MKSNNIQDDFPPGELKRTIESIAEAILEIEVGALPISKASITEFVNSYLSSIPPDLKKRAKILFSLFKYSPLLYLKLKTFPSLALEGRRKILDDFMRSNLRSKLLIFKTLKALSVMGYYRNEETWKDIGYDGPTIKRFPISRPTILERGEKLKTGDDVSGDIKERTDVCVIGSGAGGAVIAKELSQQGLNVILLEMGGYNTARDFNQREEDMYQLLFEEAGSRATDDYSINVIQGKGIGGSTVHNTSLCFRAPKAIIEFWEREWKVEGLNYNDLDQFYNDVEKTLSVNPIGIEEVNTNNAKALEGARKLGWSAILSNHNRSGECPGCGFCILGCSYDKKQSMLLTYIPLAYKNGTKIFADCKAERIDLKDGRAKGVHGRFYRNGKPTYSIYIEADAVIVSGGSINTPKLLLMSGIDSGGKVGQNLHLHPFVFVGGIFDENIDGWKGVPQSVVVDEFLNQDRQGLKGYLIMPGFAHPMLFASLTPSFGIEHRRIMKLYSQFAILGVLLHDSSSGRVYVSKNGESRISYALNEDDKRELMHGIKKSTEILFEAGAKEVVLPYVEGAYIKSKNDIRMIDHLNIIKNRTNIISVHPQSTCPMGEDKRRSVVDSFCRFHGIENLYISDGSVFPTSIGVPPQITIMALATRAAGHIAKRLGK
jgi:choline dehydrogenase-like flavoprotein